MIIKNKRPTNGRSLPPVARVRPGGRDRYTPAKANYKPVTERKREIEEHAKEQRRLYGNETRKSSDRS